MTPNDIYKAYQRGSKSYAIPEDFYQSPHTGINYKELNHIDIPTYSEIGEHQISTAISMMPIDQRLAKVAHKLTLDMTVPLDGGGDEIAINQAIEKIEQALSYREKGGAANISSQTHLHKNVEAMKKVYEDLAQRLSFVTNLIKSSGGALPGTQLAKELERVEQGIVKIQNNLAALGEPSASIVSPETMGFLKSAEWLGRRIKGKYLEVVGTDWFNNKLPANIRAVNVGKVQGPVLDILGNATGSTKMIRTDIMLFDITSNIKLTFTVGKERKEMSVQEFIDFIEKNGETTTITLEDDDYDKMKKALVSGVQAKAGQGQAVFNPKPVSINQAIQLEGVSSRYAKALELLSRLAEEERQYRTGGMMQPTADAYQALFNYCLAKGLQSLIGKENSLVLTRNGVMTMRDYLYYQWRNGERKIAQAKNRVNINHPEKMIPVFFSGQSFLSKS